MGASVGINPEREQYLLFTGGYLKFHVVVVREEEPFVSDMSELAQARFALPLGYNDNAIFRQAQR